MSGAARADVASWRMHAGRIEISAQNHNFAVDPATLPAGVEVTHVNLNDGTCAGMVYPSMKAMSIQVRGQPVCSGPPREDLLSTPSLESSAGAASLFPSAAAPSKMECSHPVLGVGALLNVCVTPTFILAALV